MRPVTVNTKGVLKLTGAVARLLARSAVEPGLAVVPGPTGSGKSTAVARCVGQHDAVYVRANAATGFGSLLAMLCFELGLDPKRPNAARFDAIAEALKERPRPVFIDEADYLARDGRMLEVLRDLHDVTGAPVFMVGMGGFERVLSKYPQIERRVSLRLDFGPCDMDDAAKLARELCEVEIEPALVEALHKQAKGSVGLIVVALARMERMAKESRAKSMTMDVWGNRPMFAALDAARKGAA